MFWNESSHLLTPNESGERSKNDILFTIEFFALTAYPLTFKYIQDALYTMETAPGLYQVHPDYKDFSDKDQTYISHDNLTAIVAFVDSEARHKIWQELCRQSFRYDNVTPSNPSWGRIMHPRDIIYYGIMGGEALMWLLFPLFAIMSILSMFGSDTSGKLLFWLRCQGMKDNLAFKALFKICTQVMKMCTPYESWGAVFRTYFPNPSHPLHQITYLDSTLA